MRDEQDRVRELISTCHLEASPSVRCLDLVSEVGEASKELLKATNYGKEEIESAAAAMKDELGDCLFSLLALCDTLGVDAQQALEGALNKYRTRWETRGNVGSGR